MYWNQVDFSFVEIPTEIGALQRLRTLDIEFNLFSGPIPPFIFNLSSLVILGLSGNNFTGGLPDDICEDLPSLGGLYLSYNQLSGQLPSTLWRCENLGDVALAYNQFIGSIPRSVGNLTRVKRIFLGVNYLSGTLLTLLFQLCNCSYTSKTNLALYYEYVLSYMKLKLCWMLVYFIEYKLLISHITWQKFVIVGERFVLGLSWPRKLTSASLCLSTKAFSSIMDAKDCLSLEIAKCSIHRV